jgi:preprotein translocase subunit SecA
MSLLAPLTAAWQFVAPRSFAPVRDDWRLVHEVQQVATDWRTATDLRLKAAADELRELVADGEELTSPELLLPALALTVEAVRRVLSIELYDVQILAGLVLARGQVAEMATGEGKTLAAALPALAHSLAGKGVHVVTPNAYLAERDWQLLAPVFRLLGAWSALLPEQAASDEKRSSYAADITYGTGYEFGFDYLRDQLVGLETAQQPLGHRQRALLQGRMPTNARPMQREHAVAIVDEIDSVLIDEANLPLILSSPPAESAVAEIYHAARTLAATLVADRDYRIDLHARSLTLTTAARQAVANAAPRTTAPWRRAWHDYVQQALVAQHLLVRDADYVVLDGQIAVVDQHSGRVFAERSWRDGLQQALEAKERLPVTAETHSAARVTRQRYFRRYQLLCGMTGTTSGSEREFWQTYRLSIVRIPRRVPSARTDLATRYFATDEAKVRAIIAEIRRLHATGRPLLVGTRTIEASEKLARRLADVGVSHSLLNGKQTADEATVIARAGLRNAVTIATNLAGRGTDIRLGSGVAALGGLHVLATERHLNRRIDEQLAGRAARQGDPGSSQFFVSAEDRLVALWAPELAERFQALADGTGEVHASFDDELTAAQHRSAEAERTARRALASHDDWLDEFLSRAAGK